LLEEVDRLTILVDTLLRLSYGDAGAVRYRLRRWNPVNSRATVVSSLGILVKERGQRFVFSNRVARFGSNVTP
jgi:hypothetical protein